ncbi:hypothetical protein [Candidatus Agathobaculum pullicola]|uniref:hypothetical protein n=1 Tax=Candidatus Agathobaculum pullicola TaxID=2838426 RepID=UPI003F919DC8
MGDTVEHLFRGNPYVETVIIQQGVIRAQNLCSRLHNLKNIIVMSNESNVSCIACDCPQMNTIIVGANLKDSSLTMGYNEFDSINKTTGNNTGSMALSYPDPVDNLVMLSSVCGDFQKQFAEAKTLIAEMNLPQFALDLLPANLGGGADAVELPQQAPVTVSPWAESVVDEAEAQKLFPYRIYDVYGRDFTRNITRYEFALLAVRTYEVLSNDYRTPIATFYMNPELGQSDSLRFPDCEDEGYGVDSTMSQAYNLGIISGYSKPWPTYFVGKMGKSSLTPMMMVFWSSWWIGTTSTLAPTTPSPASRPPPCSLALSRLWANP